MKAEKVISSYEKKINKISPKKVGEEDTTNIRYYGFWETERDSDKDLCNLSILMHHLIRCSRKNRQESKRKNIRKEKETYL